MLDTQEVLNNLTNLNFYCVRADQSGLKKVLDKEELKAFLGGAVVGNPPANAGDTGLGRSHMPRSN